MSKKEIPEELKKIMETWGISDNEMEDIMKDFNLKFYWKKDNIIKEFCESDIWIKIENKFLFLKEHYLPIKSEHERFDISKKNMSYKFIFNKLSPYKNLEMHNNHIKKWINHIKDFQENQLKAFAYILLLNNEDFWEVKDKYFIEKYIIDEDWLPPCVRTWFHHAYVDFFEEICINFSDFLENKIKEQLD